MTDRAEDVLAAPGAPLTRRQALQQERLTNTGSIVQIDAQPHAVISDPTTSISKPQAVEPERFRAAVVPTNPVPQETPEPVFAPEKPALTRREMRAMRQAVEAVEPRNAPEPTAPVLPTIVTPQPQKANGWATAPKVTQPSVAVSPATSEFNILTGLSSREPGWVPSATSSEKSTWIEPDSPAVLTSRDVSVTTAGSATNALILSSLPQPDVTAPLNETGEILLTGSIDLPPGFGTLGANPSRFDPADIDESFEAEIATTTSDLAPVYASRAISSQPVEHELIAAPKRRNTTLPMVLMIAAGTLAVGVSGLLVAYVFHIL